MTEPGRMPAHKRRRLASDANPAQHIDPDASNATSEGQIPNFRLLKAVACSSCHRALTGPKSAHAVICARCVSLTRSSSSFSFADECFFDICAHRPAWPRRCNAPTCPICSRTCSAAPPSQPPTPLLTYSPTPPATPAPSPRRMALSLSNNNVGSVTPRRRKVRDEDGPGVVQDAFGYGNKVQNEQYDGEMDGWTPGCGRIVCKNCCLESPLRCVHCADPRYECVAQSLILSLLLSRPTGRPLVRRIRAMTATASHTSPRHNRIHCLCLAAAF